MLESSLWTHWWGGSDLVIRTVFIVLVGLSILGWSVISYKLVQYYGLLKAELKLRRQLRGPVERVDLAATQWVQGGVTADFWNRVVRERGHQVRFDKPGLLDRQAEQFLEDQRIELENGLILLAIIGNSAPFIGLLGTVWGIMHALQSLGGSSQLTMGMVAGPVSEALVATAVGLFAAIPAAAAYNLLVRWLRRISSVMASNLREMRGLLLIKEETNHVNS
ncbi:MAG: MotA/TolQ/ExbB proton channel family protein [Gammaproteobacteria bacterium]|jgi:biopolymer transport protein ExbB|nr:MotA/TolQ/ExbB proton channel family protein [Gammaproteobacteria bacterium]MBT3488488.1 MotA/TolQ/ExbB proton channel family protein [Gammaproteobacteria bacterium]MBT3718182.1 MotA/TolQ/ExbB proton channel family protein [Gammaproteobacteria bacterium]MBT3844273.1 MotA/TolQ/ExbB proton channel family protein [Gammaproteobacteria bacterium]MBT3893021.1 MotA/TolQ/ExbB proton channel family protein [Gammaproteobacteria bacterium]